MADDAVFGAILCSDAARHNLAGIDTDPDLEWIEVHLAARFRQCLDRLLGAKRRARSGRRMVGVRERGAEQRHQTVANELVQNAAFALYRIDDQHENVVQRLYDFFRLYAGRERREPAHIGE